MMTPTPLIRLNREIDNKVEGNVNNVGNVGNVGGRQ
jgi:hypothetical protein